MRRYLSASTAAAALAMMAGSAFGAAGNVIPIQPVVSNAGDGGGGTYEVVGTGGDGDVSIIVELDDVATDNTAFMNNIQVQFYGDDGMMVGPALTVAAADISDALGNNDGNIDNNDLLTIDLTQVLQFQPAGAFSLDVIYTDPGGDGDSLTMDNDGFPGLGDDSDDTDEFYRIITTTPEISGAFIQEVDAADDKIFVTISFPALGIGDNNTVRSSLMFPDNGGESNPNNIMAINTFDFEKDTGSGFEQFEADDITAVAALMDNDVFLEIDFDEAMSDLGVGDEIRVDMASGDIRDGTGNLVGGTGTLASLPDLAVTSATWQQVVTAAPGAVAGAIKLEFNLDLDNTDLGTAAFYNSLEIEMAAAAGLSVTDVTAGDDPNCVLLEVTQAGANDVTPAGVRGSDGEAYALNVDTDMTAGEPSDVFGNAMTTDITNTIADGISPVLDALGAYNGGIAFKDTDGDGVQDAVLFVFGEPLDSSLDGADADDLGITLTRLGGVTLNPIGMIDDVTGVMESYMTTASMMADDDEIDITGVTLDSFDADNDGTISDLEMNNALCVSFDPAQDFEEAGGGWDNDTDTDAGTGDGPGSGDLSAVQGEIDADDSDITDANMVSIDSDADADDTDDIDETTDTDAANPVIVGMTNSYRTGDNFSGGNLDTFVETDGNVGDDDDNNVFYGIFSEGLTNVGDDPSLISWGGGATERFQAGDTTRVVGADNNILQIEDSGARGFAPGDTLTFSAGHMIDDAAGNEISGQLDAPDRTPPFVARQTDINGNNVLGAYLFDLDDDGFADEARLFTSVGVDEATVQLGDFAYSGGEEFDTVAVNPAGTQITLTFAAGANIPVSNPINVTYTAPANNDDMDSQIIAGTDGNSVFPGIVSTIQAVQFPTALIDTDDLAIMDIRGNITFGSTPIGVGAKVYGMVAVPVPSKLVFTADNITRWVDDSASLEAFFDFIYGIEDHLYAINDDGDFFFVNSFGGPGTTADEANGRAVYDIAVNASNLERVTFQGQGRSYTNGDSQPERNLRIQNGSVTFKWDVLRSNGGDIVSFKSSGYDIGGDAIASRAVVEDAENGAYAMHVSAPITQFYGTFGQTGWPVIIVVEQATGERFAATSLLNATDNMGSLLFNPLQRSDDADTDNARGDGSNVVFDIDLDNLGTETLYTGWQLLSFNRVSGYARSSGDIPTLPAIQGGDDDNIVSGSSLPNDHPFNQFAFFDDDDNNGEWTAADDNDFMDSLIIDVACIDGMWFTMDDNGVNIGNNISAFIGGFGAGFHKSGGDQVGVFQFGAAGSASTVFPSGTTFNSNSTLDWAIVTAPADDSDPDNWLSGNAADFLIEFNRMSNTEVDVNTQGGGINDVMGVNMNQAYFTSFE